MRYRDASPARSPDGPHAKPECCCPSSSRLREISKNKPTGPNRHFTPKSARALVLLQDLIQQRTCLTPANKQTSANLGTRPCKFCRITKTFQKSATNFAEQALSHIDPFLRFSLSLARLLYCQSKSTRIASQSYGNSVLPNRSTRSISLVTIDDMLLKDESHAVTGLAPRRLIRNSRNADRSRHRT